MPEESPLLPDVSRIALVTADDEYRDPNARVAATRDHALIRRWAEAHHAEPATGERTPSGPTTVDVNDGGAGIRFNHPGVGRFRPITWDEFFDNFDEHGLAFVYERETAGKSASSRYRFVKFESLSRRSPAD
jgi:hypothetical protein